MESQTRNTESLDSRLGIGLGIGLDVKPCIESYSESDSNLRPGQYQTRYRDSKIGTRETLKCAVIHGVVLKSNQYTQFEQQEKIVSLAFHFAF